MLLTAFLILLGWCGAQTDLIGRQLIGGQTTPLGRRRYARLDTLSPTVFRRGSYRFFFFSREEERVHVHVLSPDGEAKFWLEPTVALAHFEGLNQRQLKHSYVAGHLGVAAVQLHTMISLTFLRWARRGHSLV